MGIEALRGWLAALLAVSARAPRSPPCSDGISKGSFKDLPCQQVSKACRTSAARGSEGALARIRPARRAERGPSAGSDHSDRLTPPLGEGLPGFGDRRAPWAAL